MGIPEVRLVLRRLLRSPMFSALTLLTLAIGIGANTAIFSVLNGVLLKPLPYPDAERLVGVWHTAPGLGFKQLNSSPATYFTYREEGRSFQGLGLYASRSASVTGMAEPEQVDAMMVTHDVLPTLGVQPFRGRWFSEKEDVPKGPKTVVLTYGYWQRKFGGDTSVVGRTVLIDGNPHEVIGVMPDSFSFLNYRPSVFLSLQFDRAEVFVGNFSYNTLARLKPGVGIEQANADVARMLPMLTDKFKLPPGMSFNMLRDARIGPNIRPLKQDVVGDIGNILWVLMATVGIVLFIACANVANLLLVRAEGRQQEFAVRSALGASWWRLARDLLTETVTLGLLGGALGIGFAYGAIRLLVYLGPANFPRMEAITIDTPVLLFALAVSMTSGLLFGLAPVFKYAGTHVNAALRAGNRNYSESRERHRARSVLVVVQIALALVLLIGSGLMMRTFSALRAVEPGFRDPAQVLTLRVSIPTALVREPERVARMFYDMSQNIASVPGVSSVGLSNSITMDGSNNNDPIFVEDKPASDSKMPAIRRFKHISPGYFQAMGNPLRAGRDLTWTDVLELRPVAIISDNLAREYWGSAAAALGKRIRENPKGTWREIVGVAGDDRDDGVDRRAPATVYWPMLKSNFWGNAVDIRRNMAFAIRSNRTGSIDFPKDIQQAIWSVSAELPVANVRTVKELYDRSLAKTSFTLVMLGLASSMALLLGVVGIYGVISYSISQRTREIGIRMALGAPQESVRGMFVRHGLLLAAIGVGCGLAAAVPLTRLMSALLFEVSPADPVTYAAVSVVLVLAALLAAYVPARRATMIEPVVALRGD